MSREFIAKPLLWWCFVPQSNPKINVPEGNNMFFIVCCESRGFALRKTTMEIPLSVWRNSILGSAF